MALLVAAAATAALVLNGGASSPLVAPGLGASTAGAPTAAARVVADDTAAEGRGDPETPAESLSGVTGAEPLRNGEGPEVKPPPAGGEEALTHWLAGNKATRIAKRKEIRKAYADAIAASPHPEKAAVQRGSEISTFNSIADATPDLPLTDAKKLIDLTIARDLGTRAIEDRYQQLRSEAVRAGSTESYDDDEMRERDEHVERCERKLVALMKQVMGEGGFDRFNMIDLRKVDWPLNWVTSGYDPEEEGKR